MKQPLSSVSICLIRSASSNEEAKSQFELLIRSLLVRPDQPAVIVLGHFSPQIIDTHGYHGPEVMHSVVSQFYDVPHIG